MTFNLSKQPCFYCGLEYSREIKDRRAKANHGNFYQYGCKKCNGIDKVDSSVAYIKGIVYRVVSFAILQKTH